MFRNNSIFTVFICRLYYYFSVICPFRFNDSVIILINVVSRFYFFLFPTGGRPTLLAILFGLLIIPFACGSLLLSRFWFDELATTTSVSSTLLSLSLLLLLVLLSASLLSYSSTCSFSFPLSILLPFCLLCERLSSISSTGTLVASLC